MTMPPGPLSYTGVLAVPYLTETFDPTSSNITFTVPTVWVNTSVGRIWMLAKKPLGVADWILIGSGSEDLSTLTGNDSIAVGPTDGNINVVGDGTTIDITGDAATSTLTVSVISPLPVPSGGTGATTLTGVLIGNGTAAITGNPITQYDVLVGGASNAITSIGPGVAGEVFLSGGPAANPDYSTTFSVNDSTISATLVGSSLSINTPRISTRNTGTGSVSGQAANIRCDAHSSASVADTGFFSSGQWDIPQYWNFGMTSTATSYANAFNISYAAGTSSPEGGVVGISISPIGVVNVPTNDLRVSRTISPGGPQIGLSNFSSTTGATARMTLATNATGATSDCYFLVQTSGASSGSWEHGVIGATKNYEFQSGPNNTHTYMDGSPVLTLTQNGSVGICSGSPPSFASGAGVLFIANAGIIPSTTPTGGGVLYVSAGALRYIGSSGTVTVLGPA